MNDIFKTFETDEEVVTNSKKYLTFLLNEQYYAFSIEQVIEIIEVQQVTVVPEFPHYVKGIINLRGKIIPIVDVRLRFNMEEKEYTTRTCIIVVNINGINIGYIVDTVSEVLDIPNEDVSAPPKVSTDDSTKFLTGVGKV